MILLLLNDSVKSVLLSYIEIAGNKNDDSSAHGTGKLNPKLERRSSSSSDIKTIK